MQKLRIKFSKEGSACYISHLDLMRTLERSLRRANLSLAFSEGFNPHPKMSFASALSLGVPSQGEYMDLELEKPVVIGEVLERLNQVLPSGIKALAVEELGERKEPAMAQVEAASYQIEGKSLLNQEKWQDILDRFPKQKEILIERDTKKGLREVDIAPFLLNIQLSQLEGEIFTLYLMVRAGSKGNLRPQEVLQALEKYYQLTFTETRVRRTGLYKQENDQFRPLISTEDKIGGC